MNSRGSIIILAATAMALLMAISAYFLSSLAVETRISGSMESAQKAHYLAEAGINEAIWRLNNDSEWRDSFIDPELNPDSEGNYWSATVSGSFDGSDYSVTVENNGPGRGEITAVSEVPFLGSESRREVKVSVFRAFESPTDDSATFSGGVGSNMRMDHIDLTINGGNIFANHNLIIAGQSNIKVYDNEETEKLEGKIMSTQNINIGNQVELENYELLCSMNYCDEECESCPPEEKAIPMVDFDSDHQNSFKSRAEDDSDCSIMCKEEGGEKEECSTECIFSSNEFEELLWEVGEGGKLILESEVTYVTGDVDIRGGRSLEIKGVLVSDRNIFIGERKDWNRRGDRDEGYSHVSVERLTDRASGLLAKRNIELGPYSLTEDSVIEGVIYAGNRVNMTSVPYKLDIFGGVIGRHLFLTSLWEGLEITLDNENILYGLGYIIDEEPVVPIFSPVIQIDHWEEVY